MTDLPPPNPTLIEKPASAIEQAGEVVVGNSSVSVDGKEFEYQLGAPAEEKMIAQDEDLLFYAQELSQVFNDGFQWSDLSTIARLSIEFVSQFDGMTEKEQRDAVVHILDYIIDITDTPYLPDFITDPICKALVPPFIDLMISIVNGETWSQGADRYGELVIAPTSEEVAEFTESLKPLLAKDFTWSVFFDAFKEALGFFATYSYMPTDQKKAAIYEVLAFIIDETTWPYHLDPILDPLTKAILPPVINLVMEKI